jgi:5-methylthioadenosine/S-adenosylhomocysteine deaminase
MKKLIENVDILTMDKEGHFFEDGVILYKDDTIEYVGPRSGLQNWDARGNPDLKPCLGELDNVERIDGKGMLALPGFINAHCHVSMTIFRGYADNMPLWEWLSERIWPLEEKLVAEDAYWLTLLGTAEMISAGVTTFSDMYMFMSQTAKAVLDCGMRAVLGRGLTGPDNNTQLRHKEVEELFDQSKQSCGRISTMIAPHAVYTCSPEYLKTCLQLAERFGVGIHIHMSETEKEVADCVREYGKTPVRHLYDLGLFDVPITAAHCVHLTHDDMELMEEKNVKAVHCPSSNMKLASGFAPVDELLERGICVALGTDGAASNNNLSILKEMSLAALIAKGRTGNARALSADTAIKMATIQGARALSLEQEIGSLEPGKKADIQLIDFKQPHYYPKQNPSVHLVYSGHSGDVNTVIIDGQIVMQDRNLTTINMDEVYNEVDKIVKRIL